MWQLGIQHLAPLEVEPAKEPKAVARVAEESK
jgi:hypothetical protein